MKWRGCTRNWWGNLWLEGQYLVQAIFKVTSQLSHHLHICPRLMLLCSWTTVATYSLFNSILFHVNLDQLIPVGSFSFSSATSPYQCRSIEGTKAVSLMALSILFIHSWTCNGTWTRHCCLCTSSPLQTLRGKRSHRVVCWSRWLHSAVGRRPCFIATLHPFSVGSLPVAMAPRKLRWILFTFHYWQVVTSFLQCIMLVFCVRLTTLHRPSLLHYH